MFTEILRIKPVLDKGATAAMEASLGKRFSRVASRFGRALKNVVKGSVIGISLGLLAKILNPLQELEDKIKSLLGQGTDLRDMADRFGSTPGNLSRLQDLGASLGLKPEELRDVLTKYAQTIEKARMELLDPSQEISASTRAVSNFVDISDLAQSFFQFTQSLKSFGNLSTPFNQSKTALIDSAYNKRRQGKPITQEERQALSEYQAGVNSQGLEARRIAETEVFGAPLTGASKRLIDADVGKQLSDLKLPSTQAVTEAANKLASLEDKKNLIDVRNQTQDFVNASQTINGNMIAMMAAAEKRDADFATKQLKNFEQMQKGAQAVTDISEGIQTLIGALTQLLGKLTVITNFIPKITSTRWWNSIGGGK